MRHIQHSEAFIPNSLVQSFYQTSAANRSNCFSIGHHSWVSPPVAMTTDDIINLVDPRQVDANAWTKSTSLSNSKYLIGIQRIKGRPSHVLVIVPTFIDLRWVSVTPKRRSHFEELGLKTNQNILYRIPMISIFR